MEFATPAAPTGAFKPADHIGSLLVIEPLAVETGITTVNGPADALRANVTILDGPHAGERADDALIWGKVLRSQLAPLIGQKVLGRLGQGAAKPGQSPAWVLNDPTDDDKATAKAWATGANAPVNAAAPF